MYSFIFLDNIVNIFIFFIYCDSFFSSIDMEIKSLINSESNFLTLLVILISILLKWK